jgi:hypothetical protein
MVTNNLLIRLKNRDSASIAKARDTLLGMRGKIESLRDIRVELNIRPGAANYDLMLITQYDDMAGLEAYLVHPVHLEVSKYIVSVIDTSASVCYES